MGTKPIGLTSLVLTETLQGIRLESRFRQALAHFRSMAVFNAVSPELAVQSAEHFRTLRSSGVTIRSTIDCLLATFCIVKGYGLLHNDRDFDAFERHLGLERGPSSGNPPAIETNGVTFPESKSC